MKRFIVFVVIALIAVVAFFVLPKVIKPKDTPIPEETAPEPTLQYYDIVVKYTQEYDLPIDLVYGVIETESHFDSQAVSPAGAKGLMQITEPTFDWLMTKNHEAHSYEELLDPEINVKFGCFFLSLLYKEFENWDTALAAYNAGRTRVNKWLADDRYSSDGILTWIPYDETRNYVEKVNAASQNYKYLISQTSTEQTYD